MAADGTGDLFSDLGYADAARRQAKLRLAAAVNGIIERQRLSLAAAAAKLGVDQPKASALANCKLDGFSLERLTTFLTALDQDVAIIIEDKAALAIGWSYWRACCVGSGRARLPPDPHSHSIVPGGLEVMS